VISATLGLLVRDYLHLDNSLLGVATITGILMAGRTVMSMVGAYIAGYGSDIAKNRWLVMSVCLGLCALSLLVLSSLTSLLIIIGVAFIALARGGVQSLTTSLTGDLVPVQHRGRAVGILHTVGDFGSAVGPSAAFFLIPFWGLPKVYMLCAAIFSLSWLINVAIFTVKQR
ncbi:MAG: MFS transporter, partial [Anaerolineae bacterium]|nr:MFS transporter [Anaerolineae bacterium]